ncbi:hypothetical protein FOXYSP1_19072 [Fusarium oxysporum f. sp. phaseoli]
MLFISHEEGRSKYSFMDHDILEEELKSHVWLGDFALPFFGDCSRVKTRVPKTARSTVSS